MLRTGKQKLQYNNGMTNQELLDLYTDYLISSFGPTTGTGLSRLTEGAISHDRIQRFLASPPTSGKELWQVVKPYVRQLQVAKGVLIVDDSIMEKPHTDENEIVAWHYDHTSGQSVKGVNFLTALYHVGGVSLPITYHVVEKTEHYHDPKSGKARRRSPIGKNEIYRDLLRQVVHNQVPFRYVLNDVWYASADNMRCVVEELGRHFIMPLKSNRKVAPTLAAKQQGQYVRIAELGLEPQTRLTVYVEQVAFPLYLVKQVFVNGDGSTGTLYLVTSDGDLTYDGITTLYRTRWNVEPYHKSLKQNASLAKSPTKTVTTQRNHLFASLCAYVKLELLRVKTNSNHFAIKTRLYLNALRAAFDTLQHLQRSIAA